MAPRKPSADPPTRFLNHIPFLKKEDCSSEAGSPPAACTQPKTPTRGSKSPKTSLFADGVRPSAPIEASIPGRFDHSIAQAYLTSPRTVENNTVRVFSVIPQRGRGPIEPVAPPEYIPVPSPRNPFPHLLTTPPTPTPQPPCPFVPSPLSPRVPHWLFPDRPERYNEQCSSPPQSPVAPLKPAQLSISTTAHSSAQIIPLCPARSPPPPPFAELEHSSSPNMASYRESQFLGPDSAVGNELSRHKVAAIQIAKDQENAIHQKLRRNGDIIPEYEFLELIGKGSYGRVFKALDKKSKAIVALKVMDVDDHDYKSRPEEKDETVEVTLHEIKVLQQLKDSKARNVNAILDAFQMHSQLWIVNEYCPGGSLHTLMRGTGNKLEDKYIIPIARELAEALKAIHEAGIIHRDVKAANVMIHENGKLQVIDFGVAGVLQTKLDKRTTVIGTPHWMAPELHKPAGREGLNYGTEVDVWAYGCTLYEIASGTPPYPRTEPGRKLGVQLGRQPPRLSDSQDYSEGLKDLVAFVLEAKPSDRPSMQAILEHSYVKESEATHPTESLAELVKAFYRWEHSGGQRTSLFMGGGAAAAQFPNTLETEDDWNFSTTAGFEQQFTEPNPGKTTTSELVPTLSQHNIALSDFGDATADSSDNYLLQPNNFTPSLSPGFQFNMSDQNFHPHPPGTGVGINTEVDAHDSTEAMTPQEKATAEARIKRGEKALQSLFDEKQEPYQYGPKTEQKDEKPVPTLSRARSDLPLRDDNSESSIHHKELIITHNSDGTMELPNIDLADTNTIKPGGMSKFLGTTDQGDDYEYGQEYEQHSDADKRATMDWKFPGQPEVTVTAADDTVGNARDAKRDTAAWTFPAEAMAPQINDPVPDTDDPTPIQTRPALHHVATASEPVDLRQSIGGVLDLDAIYDSEPYDSELYASDAFRTAPSSDDETVAHDPSHEPVSDRPTSDQPMIDQSTPVVANDEKISPDTPGQPDSATYTDSDDEYYHPFKGARTSDDKLKGKINAYLDEKGVTDVMERAALRRDLMKSAKGFPSMLTRDKTESGLADFKARDWTPPLGKYQGRVQGKKTWRNYNPARNPANDHASYALGEPTASVSALAPLRTNFGGGGNGADGRAANAAGATLPDILPPLAAAMRQDAPAHIVEAELRRLLNEFDGTLASLGEFFDAHAANLRGGNGGSSGGEGGSGGA